MRLIFRYEERGGERVEVNVAMREEERQFVK
jgi:hypothetical protein